MKFKRSHRLADSCPTLGPLSSVHSRLLSSLCDHVEQRCSAGSGRVHHRCSVQNRRGRNRQSCGGRDGGAAAGNVPAGKRDKEAEEQHRGSSHGAESRAGAGDPGT